MFETQKNSVIFLADDDQLDRNNLIRNGKFPSQVNLGPRAVGWVENEIVDWIEARIDETRAREYRTT